MKKRSILLTKKMVEQYTNSVVRQQTDEVEKTLSTILVDIAKDIRDCDEIVDAFKCPLVAPAHSISLQIQEAKSVRNALGSCKLQDTIRECIPKTTIDMNIIGKYTDTEYKLDTSSSYRSFISITNPGPNRDFSAEIVEINRLYTIISDDIRSVSTAAYRMRNTKAFFLEYPKHEEAFYTMFKSRWELAADKAKEYSATRKTRIEENKAFAAQRLAATNKEIHDIANNLVDKNERAKEIANAISKATLINSALRK